MPPKRDSATAKGKDSKPDPLRNLNAERFLRLVNGGQVKPRLEVVWEGAGGEEQRQTVPLTAKVFSTGSYGWTASSKLTLELCVPSSESEDDEPIDELTADLRELPIGLSANLTGRLFCSARSVPPSPLPPESGLDWHDLLDAQVTGSKKANSGKSKFASSSKSKAKSKKAATASEDDEDAEDDGEEEDEEEDDEPPAKKKKTAAGGAAKRKGKAGSKGPAAKGGKKGKKEEEAEEESK
ncbi:hypothetical protein JCM8097_008080 [Rhodosporidiobolus ruineniae]